MDAWSQENRPLLCNFVSIISLPYNIFTNINLWNTKCFKIKYITHNANYENKISVTVYLVSIFRIAYGSILVVIDFSHLLSLNVWVNLTHTYTHTYIYYYVMYEYATENGSIFHNLISKVVLDEYQILMEC